MEKWFERQSRLVQILLLLIPVVNWFVEVIVRWRLALRNGCLLKYFIAILVTLPSGIIIGWLDMLWCLLFKHLILCD